MDKFDLKEFAKQLARKSKVSSVIVSDKEILYIHIDLGKKHNYSDRWQNTVGERVRETFEHQTGKKAVVGFKPLKFSNITKKQAFKGKLDGQIRS